MRSVEKHPKPPKLKSSDLLLQKDLTMKRKKWCVLFMFHLCSVPCFEALLTSPFFPFLKDAERIACNFSFLSDHLLVICNAVCPYCSNRNAFLGNQG